MPRNTFWPLWLSIKKYFDEFHGLNSHEKIRMCVKHLFRRSRTQSDAEKLRKNTVPYLHTQSFQTVDSKRSLKSRMSLLLANLAMTPFSPPIMLCATVTVLPCSDTAEAWARLWDVNLPKSKRFNFKIFPKVIIRYSSRPTNFPKFTQRPVVNFCLTRILTLEVLRLWSQSVRCCRYCKC